ncbi:sensor histidine kinase [Methylocystis parvus]|uniref:sensor histidine kinase n=1 Tax=Methylocystis parvus TaxID=134 RepID=UPI003C781B43
MELFLGLAGVEQFTQSWDELATTRTTALVINSLQRGDSGEIRFVPSPDLIAEVKRVPELKYAAFEFWTKKAVDGSSPELVALLRNVIEVNSSHTHFVLPSERPGPANGFMGPQRTPFGRFQIATYHPKFRWDDIFVSMREDLLTYAAYFILPALLSGATAWFAVRKGLLPLSQAARHVQQIDLDRLDQQLLPVDVPIEVSPFVEAVNEALIRLDAWAARQRRFTANAAHELRTPLAVMRARLENAQASDLKSELLGDASQLRSIVEQMLVAARLTDGQAPIDQKVEIVKTTGTVVSMLIPLALDRERFIDFESRVEAAFVLGNQRAIECVLTNLIDNALRSEPANGAIMVRVEAGPLISIVDHGDGVSPSHREMVFEPFWRKSEATSGSGLGLAISREIIEAHSGRVWVEETPGGGATFKVSFLGET